jgi:hypothetical protein
MHRHKKPREKEPERYYLFPGMGGRAARRKQMMMLKAGVAVGLVIAGILVLFLYFLHNRPIR